MVSGSVLQALVAKGVDIRCPDSVEIGDDVDPDLVSGEGVVIHSGCRVRGPRTVLSAGVELGAEGPTTVENCQLGPGVELKGGYAAGSVFLEGASLGFGHHVRAASILEEQASGAHTVGLKQTILFPFVTLGSLINFCDALMAGGTSRTDHSEIGSSYIHFNFTPMGDKSTPSLFGDVARGVTLREAPIFLGGQGGAVGPVKVAYGTVVGAGSILREDVLDENTLLVVEPPRGRQRPARSGHYRNLDRLLARNITYLASLDALQVWYAEVRSAFFARQELGDRVLAGAMAALDAARTERLKRLTVLGSHLDAEDPRHRQVASALPELGEMFGAEALDASAASALVTAAAAGVGYLDAVRALDADQVAAVHGWIGGIIAERQARAAGVLGDLPFV